MTAVIYTKHDCPYCVRAKDLLISQGIDYVEYIVSPGFGETPANPNQFYVTKADLLAKLPNAKTVPQIWLDNQHIGGYSELAQHFNQT